MKSVRLMISVWLTLLFLLLINTFDGESYTQYTVPEHVTWVGFPLMKAKFKGASAFEIGLREDGVVVWRPMEDK